MTLIPAYGRDYKSMRAVLADWAAGKDFRDAISGRYVSIRDLDEIPPGESISVRFNKLTRQIIIR